MSMFLGAMQSKGEQFKLIEIVHDGDAPCREYGRIEGDMTESEIDFKRQMERHQP